MEFTVSHEGIDYVCSFPSEHSFQVQFSETKDNLTYITTLMIKDYEFLLLKSGLFNGDYDLHPTNEKKVLPAPVVRIINKRFKLMAFA